MSAQLTHFGGGGGEPQKAHRMLGHGVRLGSGGSFNIHKTRLLVFC